MTRTFYFVSATKHPTFDEAKLMRKRYEASIIRELLRSGQPVAYLVIGLTTKPIGSQKPYDLSMDEYREACISMMV